MLDANLIIVSLIIATFIYYVVKSICDSKVKISENRKEEAKYKYLEEQIRKELEDRGYQEDLED